MVMQMASLQIRTLCLPHSQRHIPYTVSYISIDVSLVADVLTPGLSSSSDIRQKLLERRTSNFKFRTVTHPLLPKRIHVQIIGFKRSLNWCITERFFSASQIDLTLPQRSHGFPFSELMDFLVPEGKSVPEKECLLLITILAVSQLFILKIYQIIRNLLNIM